MIPYLYQVMFFTLIAVDRGFIKGRETSNGRRLSKNLNRIIKPKNGSIYG